RRHAPNEVGVVCAIIVCLTDPDRAIRSDGNAKGEDRSHLSAGWYRKLGQSPIWGHMTDLWSLRATVGEPEAAVGRGGHLADLARTWVRQRNLANGAWRGSRGRVRRAPDGELREDGRGDDDQDQDCGNSGDSGRARAEAAPPGVHARR